MRLNAFFTQQFENFYSMLTSTAYYMAQTLFLKGTLAEHTQTPILNYYPETTGKCKLLCHKFSVSFQDCIKQGMGYVFVCFQETETTQGEETKTKLKKCISNGNAIMLWENSKSDLVL